MAKLLWDLYVDISAIGQSQMGAVMSASNTFGTFLQTLDALGSSADKPPHGLSATIAELVKELAKKGDQSPLEQLVKESSAPRANFLDAIFASKDRGLINLTEENGTTVAHLTTLGKALSGL